MRIADFDYPLPDHRIARFPAEERDAARLLVWRGGSTGSPTGQISETIFRNIGTVLPPDGTLVFNDTRVVRARLAMFRPTGARIEILCLEPSAPADYERAFAARGEEGCEWRAMIGNAKKWKSGPVEILGEHGEPLLRAWRVDDDTVRFEWPDGLTFGQKLERLGHVPIPPYLDRDTQEVDTVRYQTVYASVEGSVAAPTAGLHFTPEILAALQTEHITLHVGAGTFLPVKTDDALEHPMHAEHFEVSLGTIERLAAKLRAGQKIIAVGTTSVRTLESLAILSYQLKVKSEKLATQNVEQFAWRDVPDDFDGATAMENLAGWMREKGMASIRAETRIMIAPGYKFRIAGGLVTNFHQPKSTLLLLVSAFTAGKWREIYDYALAHDFRFLSYGDSSLLLP